MKEPIIELSNLSKQYDHVCAVNGLNLTIDRGEVFGLLGPNGAGKSTTILMMLGLTEPTEGTVNVCGYNSTREPLLVKQKVGYLPDNIGFYDERTGLENIIYTALLNKIPRKIANERANLLLKQVGLEEAKDKKAGKYSRGMKQRLGLADVLIKNPEVIILDEPTLGIDPEGVQELLQLIQVLSKEHNITVLLSSHHLHQVQQICDRVGLFVNGTLLAHGRIEELASELFSNAMITIEAKVSAISDPLLNEIQSLEHIIDVEVIGQQLLVVNSTSDITSSLAEIIIHSGTKLYGLSIKEHGLDDIYHQYFKGGGKHEISNTDSRGIR
ncbi:ABC transporter ATP-binding protein [Halalkalibacter urbisdiaboli]|uniref:ABC transporter ATP-binding protein n=1 Tax=Halalkalibacter urbisdiaboli TaxID=1960589 RepID=UPI000B42EE25|nr:ABC transporter ATP-binding protein [Halalkalibacter urbisdiaboli]